MKTELQIQQAANILKRSWNAALKANHAHAAAGASAALSALMWTLGDEGPIPAAFEDLIDDGRERLRDRAARN